MKLKTYISAFVSPADGEIHISSSHYPAATPSYFDICEMHFDVPDAAIKASEAIKAPYDNTGDIEQKIAHLQAMLDERRAAK